MRVGVIGGTEKNLNRFHEVALAGGCEVEFHDGRMAGRGSEALDTLLARCDVIVIITRINSHAAVQRAHKFCRRHGRKVWIVRRFGLHALASIAQQASALADSTAA